MTCEHGRSDVAPIVDDFEDVDDLRAWLGLPDTPESRELALGYTAAQRRTFAQLRFVARELNAGRIPRGVIACSRRSRR